MRTTFTQFTCLTREEAIAFLARCDQTADNHGDRVAATRRLSPTSTAEERAANHACGERLALERFQKVLRGEWPASGPILTRAQETP